MLLYYATPGNSPGPVPEEIKQALQHTERRLVIEQLCERGGEAPVTALASHLSSETGGTLPDTIATLCELHLPKLENPGLVEYDLSEGVVRLTEELELVEMALERV